MPIYEYKCTKCGKEFELIQKFSDKPATKCPDCPGKVEKLISQSSFVLKGTGWYQTDFADKKPDKKGAKEKADTPKPDCSSCPSC